jgi:D-alanyl-D-alanine carboxypeptidase (penicillin-binding protein 5/6)
MDTIRNGAFGLTNTNRLIRFYKGATGLKTGSTSKAGFCISATAERDGMELICVIMGAESRDIRNSAACALLDYGFANFTRYEPENLFQSVIPIRGGSSSTCKISALPFSVVLEKNKIDKLTTQLVLPEFLSAPVEKGEAVGKIIYRIGEKEVANTPILAEETIDFIGFWGILLRILKSMSIY